MIVSLNGVMISDQDSSISIYDRGFTLGDGIFETIRAENHEPKFFDHHMLRMRKSAKFLNIPFNITNAAIYKTITELMNVNQLQSAVIRITLSRGKGTRGLVPPTHQSPTLLLTSVQLATNTAPANVIISKKTRRNECSPLSRIKTLSYLDNIIARQEAETEQSDDALLLNTQGRLADSTICNLFVITDNCIITPSEEEGALPGITRQQLMKEYNIKAQSLTVEKLMESKEAFLTNSLGIRPLVSVDGNPIGSGQTGQKTKSIMKYFQTT
jgi:branched-chain amino acid aminotransferase